MGHYIVGALTVINISFNVLLALGNWYLMHQVRKTRDGLWNRGKLTFRQRYHTSFIQLTRRLQYVIVVGIAIGILQIALLMCER